MSLAASSALRRRSAFAAVDRRLCHAPCACSERDYGSILVIVYSAFSHGVVDGIWHQIAAGDLFKVALVDVALLAAVTAILTFASRQLGFGRADEISVVLCGSKKSLASGLPIATLLYAGHVGLVVI